MMTYCEEKSVHGNVKNLAVLAKKTYPRDPKIVSENFLRVAVPLYLNIFSLLNTPAHGLRSAENITPDNHIDLFA